MSTSELTAAVPTISARLSAAREDKVSEQVDTLSLMIEGLGSPGWARRHHNRSGGPTAPCPGMSQPQPWPWSCLRRTVLAPRTMCCRAIRCGGVSHRGMLFALQV